MFNQLINYTNKTKSFHMPGHKGGKLSLISSIHQIDVTEVDGTDDLHHPTGIIKETLDYIRKIYKSGKSYMLVNGSTGGILAAISSVTNHQDKIVIGRNCHKAVYNSVLINQLNPIYLYPEINKQYGFYEAIDPKSLSDILRENPKAKALVITSPTYEGLVSDIKEIAKVTHDYGMILIVDEAHGAHFVFSEYLPESALDLGADIVIQSTHKTLPCLTQTAILHLSEEAISSGRVNVHQLEKYLSVYQTSSPSYVFMTSIEAGIKHMYNHQIEYSQWLYELEELINNRHSKYGKWLYEIKGVNDCDVTRLTYLIHDSQITMTGWALSERLRSDHQIQVELSSQNYIIGITTIADEIHEIEYFMDAIETVFAQYRTRQELKDDSLVDIKTIINNPTRFINKQKDNRRIRQLSRAKQVFTIYEATLKNAKVVTVQESIGQVSTEFIIPYPPGIPLLVPGEVVSLEIAEYIEYLLRNNMEVYGIIEGAIYVVE